MNMFEEFIFNMSELQYTMMRTSFEASRMTDETDKNDLYDKLKKMDEEFSLIQKETNKIKSDNLIIEGMKNYFINLEKMKTKKDKIETMVKLCVVSKEQEFINQMKLYIDEIKKDNKSETSEDDSVFKIIDSALSEKFSNNHSALKNEFILSVVSYYDSHKNVQDSQDYVYRLIDLLETHGLFQDKNFKELMKNLQSLEKIDGLP